MLTNFQLRKYLAREVLGETLRRPPAKERRGTVRDAAYLGWIRTLTCVACQREGRSEAAHTGDHGLGQKAPDTDAIPLCAACHRTGQQAYHRLGRAAFERAWGVECAREVARLSGEWERAA